MRNFLFIITKLFLYAGERAEGLTGREEFATQRPEFEQPEQDKICVILSKGAPARPGCRPGQEQQNERREALPLVVTCRRPSLNVIALM